MPPRSCRREASPRSPPSGIHRRNGRRLGPTAAGRRGRSEPGKGYLLEAAEGAFYAFPDARRTGMDSMALADKLLQEAHVAVTPGVAFGQAGEGHLRLSFATSDELLESAVQRIGDCLGWN